jgi:hypothetical protein
MGKKPCYAAIFRGKMRIIYWNWGYDGVHKLFADKPAYVDEQILFQPEKTHGHVFKVAVFSLPLPALGA